MRPQIDLPIIGIDLAGVDKNPTGFAYAKPCSLEIVSGVVHSNEEIQRLIYPFKKSFH